MVNYYCIGYELLLNQQHIVNIAHCIFRNKIFFVVYFIQKKAIILASIIQSF